MHHVRKQASVKSVEQQTSSTEQAKIARAAYYHSLLPQPGEVTVSRSQSTLSQPREGTAYRSY